MSLNAYQETFTIQFIKEDDFSPSEKHIGTSSGREDKTFHS